MPNGIATLFENASQQDIKDLYLQYSERFLSAADKATIQQIDDETKSLELRASILCDKDPFSPPKNSLDVSLKLVDPQKVLRSFNQGYNEYKLIIQQKKSSLEPARLYKLGLFKKSTTEDLKQFNDIRQELNDLKSEEDFEKLADRLYRNNVIKALKDEKIAILKANSNKTPASQQAALKSVLSRVQKIIKKYGECDLFKSEQDYQTLKHCGAVYDIGDDAHSWGTNLSWTLAHIRSGNYFIICSDDIVSNQYRQHYQDTPCAFAREICVVLKAGYTLHVKSPDDITLHPDGLSEEYLKHLDSTGELGSGVNPTFEEIDVIFHELERKFHDTQYFTYKHNVPQTTATSILDKFKEELMPSSKSKELSTDQETVENQKQGSIEPEHKDNLTSREGEKIAKRLSLR